jgi:hypothetical protein
MKLDSQETLTLFAVDSPAKTLVLLESGLDSLAHEVDYSMTLCVSQRIPKQKLSSWKMCRDFYQATKVATLESSSLHWPSQGIATSSGVFLIRNSSEYPNGAEESLLSQVLEQNPLDKYFLSAKAAQGILRRANKRGKTLPAPLQTALESTANLALQDTEKEEYQP